MTIKIGGNVYNSGSIRIGDESKWISVKKRHAPPMETVLLCYKGKVVVGWNESVQPEEDTVYCAYWGQTEEEETIAGCVFLDSEEVTHWMPLPKPSRENE